jgi:hypothetical protein
MRAATAGLLALVALAMDPATRRAAVPGGLARTPRARALLDAARGYLPRDWRLPVTAAAVPPELQDVFDGLLPVRPRGQRHEYSCGAAALGMLVAVHGVAVDDATLERLTRTTVDGADDAGLIAAAQVLGFDADLREHATVVDLDAALVRGDVVMIDFWASFAPDDDPHEDMGHYAVVVASDERDVLLVDPYSVNAAHLRRVPRAALPSIWYDTDARTGTPVHGWMLRLRRR